MSKPLGVIYKATNLINNKCYIGQTTKALEERKRNHFHRIHDEIYFHNALKKYGAESFKWEVLCECEDKLMLNIRETMKIIVNHSHWTENGYNLTWGGASSFGYKHSEKTRKKISNAVKGKRIGHFVSEETRQKIRASKLGKPTSLKGKKITDDHKEKIGRSNKGKVRTKEQRKVYIELSKGRQVLEETKRKISLNHGNKKYPDDIVKRAIELKREKYNNGEISRFLQVPKNTIRWWFKSRHRFI